MTKPLQSYPLIRTVAVLTLLSLLPVGPANAQQAVGVVTAVKGDAELTRGADKKPLAFRDDVVLRDIVATQEKSLARILFGGSSTVTVRELSKLEVTEEVLPSGAKRTVYDMSVGAILVRVINKLMGPGDEVQIKTPNAIAAVRGTTIFTRCLASAVAAALSCKFSLLAGNLTLTPFGKPPLTLTQNTSVSISGDQATGTQVSPITPLTAAEARQILSESDVRTALEGDGVESGIAARELQQATQLASLLVDTVIPPIPTVKQIQDASVPSDTEQTQAPVVAGGQGQAVEDAATFPLTLPAKIKNQTFSTRGESLAIVDKNTPTITDPLLLVQNSNITDKIAGDSPPTPVNTIEVDNGVVGSGGIITSNPSTFDFSGNYILVTGTETTTSGPLSKDAQSDFTLGESFLKVSGDLTSTATEPSLQFTDSTVDAGKSLISIDGSTTVTLADSLLKATNSRFGDIENESSIIGGDFLQVDGTLTANGSSPLFNIDPTSVETAGDFVNVTVDGNVTLSGQLLTDLGGTYTIGDSFLDLQGALGSTTDLALIELSGATVSTGDNLVLVGSEGTLDLAGGLLEATNSDFNNIGGDFLQVDGSLTAAGPSPLFDIDPTTVETAGDFVNVTVDGNVNLSGQLLTDVGGTYTIGESFLDLQGTLESSTGLPLVELSGSTITTGGNFIDVSGGSLLTQGDILQLGAGSNVAPDGSLLNLDGGSLAGNTVLNIQAPLTTTGVAPALNIVAGTLGATGSLAVLSDNLTLQNSFLTQSAGSVDVGETALNVGTTTLASGAPPVFELTGGTLLGGADLTNVDGGNIALGGTLLTMSGADPALTLTLTDDVLDLDGTSTVTGPTTGSVFSFSAGTLSADELVDVSFGANLILDVSLVTQTGGNINVDNVLNLANDLTTAADAPFLDISGGGLNTSGNLAFLNTEEATLALILENTYLAQSGGTINVGTAELPADAIFVGANTLTSVAPSEEEAAAPVFDLSGGELNVSQHLVSLAGGTADLGGPLLATTGEPVVNIAGDLLNIASTVNGPASGSVFDVSGGSIAATNLLTLAPDSTLGLNDSILNQSGGTINVTNGLNFQAPVTGPAAPLLNVSDGSLTATDSLLILGADLDLQAPVLTQTGGDIAVGTAINIAGGNLTGAGDGFFELLGGTFTVNNSFLNIVSGSVITEGDLFTIDGALPFTLNGSLLTQSGGTVAADNIINVQTAFAPATVAPLLSVSDGSLTANDALLVLGADADLDLQDAVLTQTGGDITVETAVKVAGGTLAGNGLDFFELLGGTFTVNDSLLNVEAGSVTTLGNLFTIDGALPFTLNGSLLTQSGGTVEADNIVNVMSAFAPATDAPLLQVAGGSLTANDSLLVLAADLDLLGSVLTQTAGDIAVGTAITLLEGGNLTGDVDSFFELLGGTFTVNTTFFNVEGGSIATEGALFTIDGGLPFVLNGSFLTQSAGSVDVGTVLSLLAPFTTSAGAPLLQVSGGNLTTDSLVVANADLTLQNSLLSQTGGEVFAGTDALAIVESTVTSSENAVFDLTGGSLIVANDLVNINGGTLNLGAELLTASGDVDANIGGDFLQVDGTLTTAGTTAPLFDIDPTMVITTGDFVTISLGGQVNLSAQLLVDTNGIYNIGDSFLDLEGSLESSSELPLLNLTNTTVSTGNDFVFIGSDGSLNLHGSLLDVTDSDFSDGIGGDFLQVDGTLMADGSAPLFNIDPTTVMTAGDFVNVTADGNVTLGGQLLTDLDGTYSIGESFLDLEGSLESTTVLPLVQLSGTSVTTGANFIDISGGSLVTQGDILELGAGSNVAPDGSLLNLDGGTVAGNTVLNIQAPLTTAGVAPALNIVAGTLGATGSLAVLSDNLTLQNSFLTQSAGSVDVGETALNVGTTTLASGAPPVFELTGGTLLGGADLTNVDGGNIALGGTLLTMSGADPALTLTLTDDVLDLDGTSTVTGPTTGSVFSFSAGTLSADELVDVSFGANLILDVSLVTQTGGNINVDNVLNLANDLTTAADAPFLDISGGGLNTSGNLAFLNTEEATLALILENTYLAQSGGTINVGTAELPADAIFVGANTLTSVAPSEEEAAAPVFDLSGGELNVSQHLVSLAGGTADLGGPLLATTGEPVVNIAGDLLNIASTVNGPASGSVFDVSGGSIAATNLLTLAPDSTLGLNDSILNQSGGTINVTNGLNFQATVTGPAAPLLNVSDGSLTATDSLLILGADLDLQAPVLTQTGGDIAVGTAINIAGGNLTGAGDGFFELLGGTFTVNNSFLNIVSGSVITEGDLFTIDGALPFTLNGSLLTQSGGTVAADNIINVQTAFAPATDTPLLQVAGGSLTANNSLLVLGANLDLLGPVLTQTAGDIALGTAITLLEGGNLTGAGESFFELLGGTFTVNTSFLNVEGGSIATEGALFTIDGGLPFVLNGSFLTQSAGSVDVGTVLSLLAPFTTSAGAPLLEVSGGNLAADSLVTANADLTLQNSLLAQTGGEVAVGTDALAIVESTVTSSENAVFDLTGGGLIVTNDLVNINGGTLDLGGELLAASGDVDANIGGNLLTIASDVVGPPSGSAFSILGGSVVSTGDLVNLDTGSTLDVANATLLTVSGGSLTTGKVLNIGGSLVTSPNVPLVDVTGGSLNTNGELALVQADLGLNHSLLRQTEGSVSVGGGFDTLRVEGVSVTSGAAAVFHFGGGFFNGSQHLVSLQGGELSLGGPLATLTSQDEALPVVTLTGDGLNIASTVTGPAEGPVFLVEAGLLSANDLVELTNESTLELTGPVLELRGEGNVVVDNVLNLGSNLTAPNAGALLMSVADNANLVALESLVNMGADLTLGNGALLQTGGTVSVAGDAVIGGANTLTSNEIPVFRLNGGEYTGAGLETAMVNVDGGMLQLGSPLAVVDNGAQVNLAGGVLHSANATVNAFGLDELPEDVLIIDGAGTSLVTGETSSLFNFNPSNVTAQSLLKVTGGANVDLSGALLTDIGSDFFLQDVVTVTGPGSSLSGTSPAALFQTNGSSFNVGGEESEVPIPGDFFRLSNGATAITMGPLLVDSGSTFNIIGRFLGIDDTSTFTSMATEPLIQLDNIPAFTTTDDIIQVNSAESLTLSGTLLFDTNSSITAGVSVLGIHDGTVTATGPNPLFSFTDTTLQTVEFDIVALFGGSLSVEGPLVIADNSDLDLGNSILFTDSAIVNSTGPEPFIQILNESTVINDTLPLIDLGDGDVNLAGPLAFIEDSTLESDEAILSIDGTNVTGTGESAFLQFVNSIASSLEAFIGIDLSEESVNLAGPLASFVDSQVTSDEQLVNILDSTVSGTSTDAFLDFQGTTVTTQKTVFAVEDSSLELNGPLVSAIDTTFSVAEAPVFPEEPIAIQTEELFLGVGPGGSLVSTTSDPLITILRGDLEPAAVNANALVAVFDNSSMELEGPLVTSDADINVNAILGVGFNSSLTSTSTEPLLQFSDGTVNAFGAFTVIFGNASVDLEGPLAAIIDAPDTINAGRFLFVSNFASLTSTSVDPLVTVTNATVNTSDFALLNDDATITLNGPFVDALNATFVVGLLDGPARFLEIQDGAQVFGPGKPQEGDAPALVNLDQTTVTSALDPQTGITRFLDVRRIGGDETPSTLDLEGPFLTISNSNVTTLADFVRITELAEVTSTAETAFIQSQNNTFNIGVDVAEEDPAFDNFFRVDDSSGSGVVGPAMVSLAGPLLDDIGSTFNVAQDFLLVRDGSALTSTTGDPLITLNGSDVSTADRFLLVTSNSEVGATLSLDGPFLHASDTTFQIDSNEDLNSFAVVGGGSELSSSSEDSLITLDTGSTVSGPIIFFRVRGEASTTLAGPLMHDSGSTIDTGRFLRIEEDASLSSTTSNALIHLDGSTIDTANDFAQIIDELSRVEVAGTVVHAENSTLDVGTNTEAPGDFLQISGGAQLTVNSDDPVVLIDGGTLTVGTDDGTSDDSPNHLVLLRGRVEQEGSDEPIIGGEENSVGSLIEAHGGAEISVQSGAGDSSGGNAVRLDQALLEASLPIIHLIGGEVETILTTAQDTIFTNFSEITSLGPLATLDKSVINVTNGALLNATNNSLVNIQSDLVKLINASRLNIINGVLVHADGFSTVNVANALVNFGTGIEAGNQVIINNSILPTGTQSGIPFSVDNTSSVNIGPNPIQNLPGNTFTVNGDPIGSEAFTGSVIQSTNNSAVNIGPQ